MTTPSPDSASAGDGAIVYCHCTYAKVVPEDVKHAVLDELSASGRSFEAVADLCEMSARKDPSLERLANLADTSELRIAACFPRAVKWLFHAAGVALPDDARVFNMREDDATAVADGVLGMSEEKS